jgi:hypothetical protein
MKPPMRCGQSPCKDCRSIDDDDDDIMKDASYIRLCRVLCLENDVAKLNWFSRDVFTLSS